MLQEIMKHIRESYGSLEEPDYCFVERSYKSRPFDVIMPEIAELGFQLADHTNLTDNLCFAYEFVLKEHRYKLKLSMVGPYALLFKVTVPGGPRTILVEQSKDLSTPERSIIGAQKSHGISVLGCDILRIPIAMQLVNVKRATVFHVLFIDSDFSPCK